jgi:hypothetical protein
MPDPKRTSAVLSQVTRNILVAFATPRLGHAKYPIDTVSKYWLPPRTTTGAA